jgi:aspartate kinase
VVLAGFQGVNPVTKEIPTLGRGGSDTTAVTMAAALKAECYEIIKEVDGVCSADPRIVANSKLLRQLDFTSPSEMCFGAPRSCIFAAWSWHKAKTSLWF